MALFLINARDKAGSLELRMANRPEHLKWAAQFVDRIAMAGPVFLEDGKTIKQAKDADVGSRSWAMQRKKFLPWKLRLASEVCCR